MKENFYMMDEDDEYNPEDYDDGGDSDYEPEDDE